MSITKHEFEQRNINRMRGVFEAMDKAGMTAGEAFETSRERVIKRLEAELAAARQADFARFNQQYLPGVDADYEF